MSIHWPIVGNQAKYSLHILSHQHISPSSLVTWSVFIRFIDYFTGSSCRFFTHPWNERSSNISGTSSIKLSLLFQNRKYRVHKPVVIYNKNILKLLDYVSSMYLVGCNKMLWDGEMFSGSGPDACVHVLSLIGARCDGAITWHPQLSPAHRPVMKTRVDKIDRAILYKPEWENYKSGS